MIFLYFPAILFGLTALAMEESNAMAEACGSYFTEIYGRCLLVETFAQGTWYDMKNFCTETGGRLVILDDANLMFALVSYIYANGLDGRSYWIGASDVASEGDFRWVDGSAVRMGTPYWATECHNGHQHRQPTGDDGENCVNIWAEYNYHFGDTQCGDTYAAVCEQVI